MKIEVVHTNNRDDPRAIGEMIPQANGTQKFDTDYNDRIYAQAVLIIVNGKRAAILRYVVGRHGTVTSHGTYVWDAYRKMGLGKMLWREAMKFTGSHVARLHCVSDRGWTLAKALERSMPNIHWEIVQDGRRRLRNLAA